MIQSLLPFVLVFFVVYGEVFEENEKHFKVKKEELERLKKECGRPYSRGQGPYSGIIAVKMEMTRNNQVVERYTTGVAISARHVLVHARSLYGDWKCDERNMPLVRDVRRYQISSKICDVKRTKDCWFTSPHRLFFRNVDGSNCKEEEINGKKQMRLHGLLLFEMHWKKMMNTKPMCLLPSRDIFNPIGQPISEYNVVLSKNETITEIDDKRNWLENCDGEPCVRNASAVFGRPFVYTRNQRNFFVGFHPTSQEGQELVPSQTHWRLDDLLMSNHAELIYNFTRIPSNYTAEMFDGDENEESTTEEPTEPMTKSPTNPAPPPAAAPITVSSLPPILGVTTSRIPPPLPTEISISPGHPSPDAPRANESSTTAEFTFGDYGDYDLMDFGDPYRIPSGGGGVATWILTWLFLIVCFLIVE